MHLRCWFALALQFILAARGFRAPLKREPSVASDASQHAASSACHLAGGFGLPHGCHYPEAMQLVASCDEADNDQPCYDTSYAESWHGSYTRDVLSSFDYSRLADFVLETDGGGFGEPISASFYCVRHSHVSDNSVAFFIGGSGRSQTRRIQRSSAMKLTPEAKTLLRQAPRDFLSRYGQRYVHSMASGGSFLGSVTVVPRDAYDKADIQAFSGLSVSHGLFSAAGSQQFQSILAQHNMSVIINAQWVGGPEIQQGFQNPEALGNMYRDWQRSWKMNPAPITLTTRTWYNIAEVQEVINSMSSEVQDLFNRDDPVLFVQGEIRNENAMVTRINASVTQALSWSETTDDAAAAACLAELGRDVGMKLTQIDQLGYDGIMAIQQQVLSGDQSWFEAYSSQDRYSACVGSIEDLVRFIRECEGSGGEWEEGACATTTTTATTATTTTTTTMTENDSTTKNSCGVLLSVVPALLVVLW